MRDSKENDLPRKFWEFTPDKANMSDKAIAGKIQRFITRMKNNDERSLEEQIMVEKYLTLMPDHKAEYIRRQQPQTLDQAADIGALYTGTAVAKEEHAPKKKEHREWYKGHRYKYREPWKQPQQSPNRQTGEAPSKSPNMEGTDSYKQPTQNNINQQKGNSQPKAQYRGNQQLQHGWRWEGDRKVPQCFKCKQWGHTAQNCTVVNRVEVLFKKPSTSEITVAGAIGQAPVSNMLMDSGADISIIEEELLPKEAIQCYPEIVNGVTRDTALVKAEIDGTKLTLYAAVVPKGTFSHPVIVGRDTLHHRVVWRHSLVPKTPGEGGIQVIPEGTTDTAPDTPPTVLAPGDKTEETEPPEKIISLDPTSPSAETTPHDNPTQANPSDTPPTVLAPGDKTGEGEAATEA